MPFPETEKVIYDRDTLTEVICQLRFPPILKVHDLPTDFQERIRTQYPEFGHPPMAAVDSLPAPLRSVLQEPLAHLRAQLQGTAHQFRSADGLWMVVLSQDFIALTTTGYTRWRDFADRLAFVVDALREVYKPAWWNRIGLRYRNLIRRSVLGLGSTGWSELIQPYVLGVMATPVMAETVSSYAQSVVPLKTAPGRLLFKHGLASREGESSYWLDADFFTEEKHDARAETEVLGQFNVVAARLFRWCIRDKLHDAMGPRPSHAVPGGDSVQR